ncbi:hypothetical protein MSAN_00289400 [Mycena sanguinolenta]|uniref:Uncharacterized protein n=1 Tax=Mycena sanguinolenta TaxID=230812 RepID=A0A8H6ZAS0_9AGAR|nr:hypothetical protein MSAN_00289400 [Mycena sanguinolenta]
MVAADTLRPSFAAVDSQWDSNMNRRRRDEFRIWGTSLGIWECIERGYACGSSSKSWGSAMMFPRYSEQLDKRGELEARYDALCYLVFMHLGGLQLL